MSNVHGYAYAIISRFFVLGFFIFGTISISYYNVLTTNILWFSFATLFSLLMVFVLKKQHEYRKFFKHWKWILLWVALNVVAIMISWTTLKMIGPSLLAFLTKSGMLFVILFGIVFLKEKFNYLEVIGGIVMVSGIVLMTFAKGDYLALGTFLVIVWGLFYALARLIVKSKLNDIDPMVKVNIRATGVVLMMLPIALLTGQFSIPTTDGLIYATVPAMFSAVFNHYFMFKAYRHLELSKCALISSLTPVLVAISSFLIFREILSPVQYVGGGLIISGVIVLVYAKKILKKPVRMPQVNGL